MSAKEVNAKNSRHALKEFLEIVSKYGWVNTGDMKTGNYFLVGHETILENVQDTSIVHVVFADKKDLIAAIGDLKKADLGVSVTVTGVFQNVWDALAENDMKPHTVGMSLGVRGNTDLLPHYDLMEVTTMCGHGMVSQGLVRQSLMDIKRGKTTAEEAAKHLATPCVCGIFNPRRAAMLLDELLDVWCMDNP